jgi:2-desacetyl-2-hydroxyethyl bacteriochlorophyllide A dehydrogenase
VRRITFTEPHQVELVDARLEDSEDDTLLFGPTVVSLISPGTELAMLRGWANDQWDVSFPMASGYNAVFQVAEVGPAVDDVARGRHVLCGDFDPWFQPFHQSFQQMPRVHAVVIPASLAPETAVFARLMVVTMETLVTTRARPPEKVLVSGLGIIGNLAAQMFTAAGYETLAWDPVPRRRELAASSGVTTLARPFGDAAGRADGAALALECSANEGAALDCIECLKAHGEVVLAARPWRQMTDISGQAVLAGIYRRYSSVRSGWEGQLPHTEEPFRSPSRVQLLVGALRWLAEGRLSVENLADHAQPDEAPAVYARLDRGEHDLLTTVFRWH